jgi:NAD(P)-dependent dehydrogenase (short-subunit alcohol dehydrogenase family)
VLTVEGDAAKRADAHRAVAATVKKFGCLDILVNNAQALVPGKLLEDIDDAC